MRTLLLVAAEARELRGVLRRCRNVTRPPWPVEFARVGELNGLRLAMVANGPGAELARVAARVPIQADAVVSTGYCGALDPALKVGEIVCGAGSDPWGGQVATVDRVLTNAAEKQALWHTGAAAVDMESAAIAEVAAERGVRCYCVRAVLDTAGEGFALDFNRMRAADGRFSRARIAAAALARPFTALPDVLKLERRGRICSRALGEFFADCRF